MLRGPFTSFLIVCCRSTTEVAEGTSTEEEPVSKKIRTAEVSKLLILL